MADDATIDQLAQGIAGIESAGQDNPYAAKGPTTSSGDRAYGKYQIMGANVPQWTDEAGLGRMTPEQFAANPDAQEKTARFKMGQYLDAHGGSMRDAASMWHAGVPYDQAAKEGRADQLGTKTTDYADRVAGGVQDNQNLSVGAAETIVALPDGTRVDLTGATDEQKQVFKLKALAKWPQLAPQGTTSTTATPTSTTPPPTRPPMRDQSVDDVATSLNQSQGLAADHWYGKYAAALGKPAADALHDVYTAINPFDGTSPAGGDPTKLATYGDALSRSLKLLHPLAVPGEAAGNVAYQAAMDAGLGPNVAALLGTSLSLGVGAKTPVPGLEVPAAPARPLQGTPATRAAAQETAAAAEAAGTTATTARAASEGAATRADEAAAAADEAARQAAPSPEAAGRAQAALTPTGTTPAAGSTAATRQLAQQLQEIKDPVQGIYNSLIETAEARYASLDPANYKAISEQIGALKDELGPTLSGAAKDVIENVEQKINTGQRLSPTDLDAYKQQLDTLFPGRVPRLATPKTRALYQFKWDVRDMARSMYDGDEQKWAEAADSLWRDTIIGKDNPTALGNLVALAKKNPATFAERVFGTGANVKQGVYANAVMRRLEGTPAGDQLREAVLGRAIDAAKDETTGNLDPAKLLTSVGRYSEDFYKAMVPDGADNFFKVLQREQSAVGETSMAAKTAAREAGAAERAATGAERQAAQTGKAAEAATAAAQAPNRLAKFTAKGIEFAGGEAIAAALGHPGWGLVTAGRFLLPADKLATFLADSPAANALARALQVGATTPAAVTVLETLRDRNKSVNFIPRGL